MFIVAPVSRDRDPQHPEQFALSWPIVFEEPERGYVTDPVAHKGSREDAQAAVDALNAALDAHAEQSAAPVPNVMPPNVDQV